MCKAPINLVFDFKARFFSERSPGQSLVYTGHWALRRKFPWSCPLSSSSQLGREGGKEEGKGPRVLIFPV